MPQMPLKKPYPDQETHFKIEFFDPAKTNVTHPISDERAFELAREEYARSVGHELDMAFRTFQRLKNTKLR